MKKIIIYSSVIGIAATVADYYFPFCNIVLQPFMLFIIPLVSSSPSSFIVGFFIYRVLIILSVIAISIIIYLHIIYVKNSSKLLYIIFADLLIILSVVYNVYNTNKKDYCESIHYKAEYHNCLRKKVGETRDPYYCSKFPEIYSQDLCYKEIALETKNYNLCDKMSSTTESSQYEKDMCYYMAALTSHNYSYCEKIRNKISKNACINKKLPWSVQPK